MKKPLEINHEVTILWEGAADQNFIKKLIEVRGGFPPIDFLPPDQFHGRNSFDAMLKALKGTGHSFGQVKGVLIIADSHDVPEDTFTMICTQVRSVADYPVPTKLLDPAPKTADHPAVAVMLLPDEQSPGALESLFVKEVVDKNSWINACVDAYLTCDKIAAHSWPPEKHAKARYHSMVAALHYDDPSRAASVAFRDPPVMSIRGTTFDDVERRIKGFCAAVGA